MVSPGIRRSSSPLGLPLLLPGATVLSPKMAEYAVTVVRPTPMLPSGSEPSVPQKSGVVCASGRLAATGTGGESLLAWAAGTDVGSRPDELRMIARM